MDDGGTATDGNTPEQESKSADDEATTQPNRDPNKGKDHNSTLNVKR